MRIVPSAIVLSALAATAAAAQEVPRPALPLEIEMPHARKLSLKSLRGKIVALTFISTT
jgi:hypothetical protein